MHYIIQENVFREEHYDLLQKAIHRLGLSHTIVRIFPFVDKIVDLKDIKGESFNVDDLPEFVPPTKNVFVFGAIKLARIAADRGWSPGSLMNSNHDFVVYSQYYKENLLNYDSIIARVGDEFNWEVDQVRFIRPTQDTKAFTGKVFNRNQWREMVEHNLYNFRSDQFNENTLIQVSTPKNIHKEIRCWVVDGKVVTASQYQLNGRFVLDDNIEPEAIRFAQKMVKLYRLADAFVIDVCLTDNGWKIVECGCINCAGFYKSNLQRMIMAVDNLFHKPEICFDGKNVSPTDLYKTLW
jgi:hypothetical protein